MTKIKAVILPYVLEVGKVYKLVFVANNFNFFYCDKNKFSMEDCSIQQNSKFIVLGKGINIYGVCYAKVLFDGKIKYIMSSTLKHIDFVEVAG